MVAIDTNLLVRFFTRDDEVMSAKAAALLSKARPSSLLLDRLVIAELGYVLASRYGFIHQDIIKIYKTLLDDKSFVVPDREIVEHTVHFFGTYTKLAFVDCWLLALKRAGKVTDIATFDVDLQKRISG